MASALFRLVAPSGRCGSLRVHRQRVMAKPNMRRSRERVTGLPVFICGDGGLRNEELLFGKSSGDRRDSAGPVGSRWVARASVWSASGFTGALASRHRPR